MQGLTTQEAQARLTRYGPNEITHKSAHTAWQIFTMQFKSPLVLLLFIATAISFLLGDTLEGVLILAIVGLNALLGFFQEYKAERALEALKKIAVSIVRVMRDGVQREIDSKLLVPGDLIFLEEGNKIPADARLIENMHLEAEEAALTGESFPVAKELAKADEVNLFMGTAVARGRGAAVVVTTGMQTRFGNIAAALSSIQKEETQLEKKLAIIAKQLGMVAIISGAIISAIGISHGFTLVSILLTAVSLAVAAVPEGLPAVITVTLAIGTQRMAKKKAILRKLTAIESLGGITVIATDKTGTLTKNEMRVTRVWAHNVVHKIEPRVFQEDKTLRLLITSGILCNNATLAPVDGTPEFDVVGDKTEGALLLLSQSVGVSYQTLKAKGSLVEEFAFDPQSKTMSVVWNHGRSTDVYAKGAPESILMRSSHIMTTSGAKPLSEKEKTRVISAYEDFAKDGLRCIALATKPIRWKKQHRASVENDLIFLGFVGISDPPRAEVAAAIAQAEAAGIRTIMITGDNELTGYAIAKHIKLIKKGQQVITGAQFASLSEEQKRIKLPHIGVFARTAPEQKLEIVRLLQEQGHVVAVTGDGVNDALALKQANVGVAMGVTGTDVAKEAADMIITDDNYATIVHAVQEGRIIYQNMKASIKYLIGSNIAEVLALLVGAILGWPFILLPIQILYINLVTDGFPALALALNDKHHNIMTRPPQKTTELFTRYDIRWLIEVSALATITTLVAFWIGWQQGHLDLARTLAFIVIAFAQQCIFLDIIAGDRSILSHVVLKNKWALVPLGTIMLQLALMYTPWFQNIFSTVSVPWMPLIVTMLLCSGMILMAELRKRFLTHLFYER